LPKLHGKHRLNVEEKKAKEELGRPRSSGPRPALPGNNKSPAPFSRPGESYVPPAGRGRGGTNNNGGGGMGGGGTQNNGGGGGGGYQAGTNNVGSKGYNKGYSNEEGHVGVAPATSAQNNPR